MRGNRGLQAGMHELAEDAAAVSTSTRGQIEAMVQSSESRQATPKSIVYGDGRTSTIPEVSTHIHKGPFDRGTGQISGYDHLLIWEPLRAVNDHIRMGNDVVMEGQDLDGWPIAPGKVPDMTRRTAGGHSARPLAGSGLIAPPTRWGSP